MLAKSVTAISCSASNGNGDKISPKSASSCLKNGASVAVTGKSRRAAGLLDKRVKVAGRIDRARSR